MSVNFSPDPATRAWLATLPGMGDAFPEITPGPARPPTQVADANGRPVDGDAASEELSFWDFLDVVNPLQHIPIVNHIYRAVTGDTIKPHAQIIGSTLFGGPLGFAVATASTVVETANGEPMMTSVARAFGSEQSVAVATTDGGMGAATPARQAMALADAPPAPVAPGPAVVAPGPAVVAPVAAPAGVPGSPSLVPTGAPGPQPAAIAAAGPVAAAPNRGPTDYFTRLQNPGGSKSVRPLATPTAPQSLGQTNNAASAPGSFRPVRIPAYVEPGAEVAAPAAEAASPAAAAQPAAAPQPATPQPATSVQSAAPAQPAPPPPAQPVQA
jgi:hypothetical protein